MAVRFALRFPGAGVGIFRRYHTDLTSGPSSILRRLLGMLPPWIATYNANEHSFTFRNGSVLTLGHMNRDADIGKYMGLEYQLLVFDQLEQFTEFQYLSLLGRLRAAGELAELLEAAHERPRAISTANPGDVGHAWVKGRWIDPAPPNTVWRPDPTEEEPEPGTRVFIPGLLTDNPKIDRFYIRRLQALPAARRRQLLYGDWSAAEGLRFGMSWRPEVHIIDPERFPIPLAGIPKGVGIDYGVAAPFCALWGAVFADRLIVVYRELYQAGLTPVEQAQAILDAEVQHDEEGGHGERAPGRPLPAWLDPSTWAPDPMHPVSPQGPGAKDLPPPGSIAWHYQQTGLPVTKAQNNRLSGVALVDELLRVRPGRYPVGGPRLLVFSSCRNLIRTLPALPRDKRHPEDVDTAAEDHAYDGPPVLVHGPPRRAGTAAHAAPRPARLAPSPGRAAGAAGDRAEHHGRHPRQGPAQLSRISGRLGGYGRRAPVTSGTRAARPPRVPSVVQPAVIRRGIGPGRSPVRSPPADRLGAFRA
jgi:hypothetical protein